MLRKLILISITLFSAGLFAETGSHAVTTNTATSLEKEAMFNILAAEFSIYRNQYDTALGFYLSQARIMDNSYIAERATQLAMYQKRYADMLEASLLWTKNSPEDPQAFFFSSLAYSFNMQANVALENMRKVLLLKGETDFTRLVNMLPKNNPSENFFIHELTQASLEYPKSYDIPLALALLYERQNQFEKSLLYTDKAIKYANNNHAVINYSVRLYAKHNQPEKALASYRNALLANPEDSELRLAFAQFAMRYNIQESKQQFLILFAESPRDDYIIFNLGLIYLEEENIESAEKMFSLLLDLKKRSSVANYYLGQIYYHKGDDTKALAAYNAITDKEEIQRASEQIVKIYLDQKRVVEAAALINKALSNPIDTAQQERLQVLKSMTLQQQGDIKGAYQLLSQLLDQNPNSIELRYSRAMLAETENELSKMETDLRYIISIRPDSALALNALGYTLADKTDRYREALQLIQQAHKLLPDDPAVLDSLGWVLYRMGRVSEAIHHLKQALILFPDAEVAAHLGEALWVSGNKNDALKVFKEALDASPNHSTITETMKRLDVTP